MKEFAIELPVFLETPTLEQIEKYLLRHNWKIHSSDFGWRTYRLETGPRAYYLETPLIESTVDYAHCIRIFFKDFLNIMCLEPKKQFDFFHTVYYEMTTRND